MKKLNWPIWLGFLICIFAFLSYPFIFVNWAATRDFPWANILLFAVGAVFLAIGIRRGFSPGRRLFGKIVTAAVATIAMLTLAMFIFVAFVASRWLPVSAGAPQVGQKAADFTLVDTNNKSVTLAELRSQPINGKPAKGVLLIFYRGYW